MTIKPTPTGVKFLDILLGGGQVPQGVHGLLGPDGGDNQLLGIMIAVEGARREREYEQTHDTDDCGQWIFVTLQLPASTIWCIARSHVDMMDQMSRDDSPESDQSQPEQGEQAREFLDRNFHVLDLSTGFSAPLNQRPVDFLSAELEAVAKHGPIRGVVIDFIGTLVKQFPPVGEETAEERVRDLIGTFAAEARRQIADRNGCPIWLVHALSDVAHKRSPAAPQSHLDAADCDHFGDDLDVCVAIGNYDREEDCFLIHCSKSPFEEDIPYMVLQMHPWFHSIVNVYEGCY